MAKRGALTEIEIGESAILVRSRGRALTISGVAPTLAEADEEEANFIVRLDDIVHWDSPHDDTTIEIEELQEILDAIERQAARRGLSVAFE
jgi:Immunity protein 74